MLKITLRIDEAQLERLDRLGEERGQRRADLIRRALEKFLTFPDALPANTFRLAQTTEYIQVVADLLVSREMPEKRDVILATVRQRLEQHHGAR